MRTNAHAIFEDSLQTHTLRTPKKTIAAAEKIAVSKYELDRLSGLFCVLYIKAVDFVSRI